MVASKRHSSRHTRDLTYAYPIRPWLLTRKRRQQLSMARMFTMAKDLPWIQQLSVTVTDDESGIQSLEHILSWMCVHSSQRSSLMC
jgi:hypothetical protein